MASSTAPARPLAYLKQALRQCRAERQQSRHYATAEAYPSLQPKYPQPAANFRPSQAIKQNRKTSPMTPYPAEIARRTKTLLSGLAEGLKKIPVVPPPRSTLKLCPDPISTLTTAQLAALDPTGARTRLFAPTNPERVQVGDILLVRLKTGDPVSGVVLNIRQRHSPIDTAILLRNQLTRVGVEMWYKIYSPAIEGIEVVQRRAKRARRAKLYYMRKPRHDVGSVEGVVKQYMRQRAGGPVGSKDTKGRDANSNKKKNNKKGRN